MYIHQLKDIIRMDFLNDAIIKCHQVTHFKYNEIGMLKVENGKRYTMQILIKRKLEWLY